MDTTKVTDNQVFKPKDLGKKKIFSSSLLESLTRTHVAIPIALFMLVAIGIMYWGITYSYVSVLIAFVTFFIGLVSFSWVEYNIHRYLFHMVINTGFKKDIQYKFHGVHHEYPKDKMRLAMPPLVSITIVITLFFLFRLIMGDFVYGFLPGFLVGYASYLFIHYIIHAFRPPKNIFRILWIHHGIHHYKRNDKAFGVSSPLWDYLYRTIPD